jgi:hypothetical protein
MPRCDIYLTNWMAALRVARYDGVQPEGDTYGVQ